MISIVLKISIHNQGDINDCIDAKDIILSAIDDLETEDEETPVNINEGGVVKMADGGSTSTQEKKPNESTNITNVNTVASANSNITTVASGISNINTVAGANSNISTVASSIADVNRYANEYKIANSTPGSPSAGDLWYDGSNNILKYYTGSTFTGITPGLTDLVNDTTPELGGHLDCNDKNLTEVGTVSGDNLTLDFGTLS